MRWFIRYNMVQLQETILPKPELNISRGHWRFTMNPALSKRITMSSIRRGGSMECWPFHTLCRVRSSLEASSELNQFAFRRTLLLNVWLDIVGFMISFHHAVYMFLADVSHVKPCSCLSIQVQPAT